MSSSPNGVFSPPKNRVEDGHNPHYQCACVCKPMSVHVHVCEFFETVRGVFRQSVMMQGVPCFNFDTSNLRVMKG